MSILGKTTPFMNGAFNNGFMRFESRSGVSGLARESMGSLQVLAVESKNKGSGQFKEFVEAAKKEYIHISFLEILNPNMNKILAKFGFNSKTLVVDGENTQALCWDKCIT